MKSATHANRGKGFEGVVAAMHLVYTTQRRASITRSPTPYKVLGPGTRAGELRVVPEAKGAPDYFVQAARRSIVLDAKDTTAEKWALSNLHEHQAQRFTAHERQGGFAFVLLHMLGEHWLLPWDSSTPNSLHEWWTTWDAGTAKRGRAALTVDACDEIGLHLPSVDYLNTALAFCAKRAL